MKRTYVPPSGDPNAKLAGCGEQPGVQEIISRILSLENQGERRGP